MATHSSIHAWRIPMDRAAWWATVHMGSQRVRHDWETNTHTHAHTHTQLWVTINITFICYAVYKHVLFPIRLLSFELKLPNILGERVCLLLLKLYWSIIKMKVDQETNVFGKELRAQLYAKIFLKSCARFKERIPVYPWSFCPVTSCIRHCYLNMFCCWWLMRIKKKNWS